MSGGFGKLASGLSGGFLWKAGAIGSVLVGLVLMAFLIAANAENRDLTRQRDALALSINDPQTGYVARLAQSRTNTEQLKAGFERQIVVMRQEAERNARVLESTRQQLQAANARARDLQRRSDRLMASPPEGENLTERILDVDRRILEDLNRAQ
jgi:hypothetical protein